MLAAEDANEGGGDAMRCEEESGAAMAGKASAPTNTCATETDLAAAIASDSGASTVRIVAGNYDMAAVRAACKTHESTLITMLRDENRRKESRLAQLETIYAPRSIVESIMELLSEHYSVESCAGAATLLSGDKQADSSAAALPSCSSS